MTARTSRESTTTTFVDGCFRPAPGRASPLRMLLTHALTEAKLTLRNGEQVLLTLLVPIAALIGMSALIDGHVLSLPEPGVRTTTPSVLALAVMSTAFTGQAIALGFDRRYGVIKRLAATALPRWTLVGGRVLSTLLVVAIQTVVLGGIALALGWAPSAVGLLWMVPVLVLGTLSFGAVGVLLGGSLRAEIVLAVANTVWFVLAGGLGLALPAAGTLGPVYTVAQFLPSEALARLLETVLSQGQAPGIVPVLVLLGWGAVTGLIATRTTRLT